MVRSGDRVSERYQVLEQLAVGGMGTLWRARHMELDVDVAPGTPLLDALPVGDARLVLDVSPSRPDLLSHLGVAREIAAALGKDIRPLPWTGARDFLGAPTPEQESLTRKLLDELPTALAGERLDASAIADATKVTWITTCHVIIFSVILSALIKVLSK